MTVHNIKAGKVVRCQEEHVHLLVEILEAFRVVREMIRRISGRGIAKENTLNLTRVLGGHCRIIAHDIGIAGIGDEDKLPVREALEDLFKEEFPDCQGGGDIAKIEWSGIEAAAGISLVNEIHVVSSNLLGSGCQVMEMHGRNAFGPVSVDIWHVHPLDKRSRERIEEALFRIIDLGDSQDVVNIADDSQALVGDEI